jgi:hypothetical protein
MPRQYLLTVGCAVAEGVENGLRRSYGRWIQSGFTRYEERRHVSQRFSGRRLRGAGSTSAFGGATGTAAPQRKLMVFNSVSLDGLFHRCTPDVNWAHARDDEWQKFTRENAGGDAELIFGRKTYEMMAVSGRHPRQGKGCRMWRPA